MKKNRVLNKLSNPSISEVSTVKTGANKLEGFDIVKSQEVETNTLQEIKKSVEEYYDYTLNNELWYAYSYACKDAMSSVLWSDSTKEEKIEEYAKLFTLFLNDLMNNPLIKSEDGKLIVNKQIEKEETIQNQEEELMQEEQKVSELQKMLTSFADGITSLFKKEEKVEEAEVSEVVEEVIEPEVKEEIVIVEEVIETAPEVVEVVTETVIEKSAEVVEIEKQYQDKVAELQKQVEDLEKSKIEQIEKAQKDELLVKAKEELSFLNGTPEENIEQLYGLKKSLDEEQFSFVYENLKKRSEIVEKALDEAGFETPDVEDETADQKIEKIAKSIESKEGIKYAAAYRKAMDSNKELADQVYNKVKTEG